MIFANPVRGTIYLTLGGGRWYRSQRFGCTGFAAERPFGSCSHFHRGIDIANGSCGDDVLAAQAGRIHFAARDSFGSIDVEIDHGGGWFTVVAHLVSEIVSVGQVVAKGQKIGSHGRTGNATGCHVHFAVKSGASASGSILGDTDGTWQDPWPLLEQNVTIHPAFLDGVNIRASAGSGATPGPKYAVTDLAARTIVASLGGAVLGALGTPYRWGGTVHGASYTVEGHAGSTWERIWIGGAFRFIASPLASLSAH